MLPRALRAQSAAQIRAFEEVFEPLGLAALAIAFVVVGGLIRLGGLGLQVAWAFSQNAEHDLTHGRGISVFPAPSLAC